jgi:CHAT domain-containing protein
MHAQIKRPLACILIVLLNVLSVFFPPKIIGVNLTLTNDPSDSLVKNYLLNAQFNEALTQVNRLLSYISDNPEMEALLLIRKSEICLLQGNLEKASQMLEIVDNYRNKICETKPRIAFLFALDKGILLRQSGQNRKSSQWLNKAITLKKVTSGHCKIDVARLYIALGDASFDVVDSINAIRYYEKAISVLSGKSQIERMLKINCLSSLQLACYYFNHKDIAMEAKSQVDYLITSIKNPNHPILLEYYLNLTSIYLNKQYNLLLAKQTLEKATMILEKYYHLDYCKQGLLFYYQGLFAYFQRDFEKALWYFSQSETYLIQNPNLTTSMYQTYFMLANIYFFYKHDYNLAIHYYNESCKSTNKWQQSTRIKCNLLAGYSYMALGNSAMAVNYTMKGVKMAEKLKTKSGGDILTYAYHCISGIYNKRNDSKEAYRYLCKAYQTSIIYPVENDIKATILRDMGMYYKNKGENKRAVKKYQQALILCSRNFNDTSQFANPVSTYILSEKLMIEILNMKAYAMYLQYNNQERNIRYLIAALQCHEIAIKIFEKRIIDMDNEGSEFHWIDIINVTLNNAVSYATMLYNLTNNLSYAEKGFQFAEKSKMLALLINNHEQSAKKFAGIPDTIIEKETWLHNEYLNLQNRIYLSESEGVSSEMKQILTQRIVQIQLESDILVSEYENRYKGYFDLKYNLNVPDIQKFQTQLNEDQVLLEYQLLKSELIIIVVDKSKVTMRLVPNIGDELHQILSFRKSVSENPLLKDPIEDFRHFTQTSFFLFSWLIKPVLNEIQHKKLIIVPHNEINLVPFELLISSKPDTENFGNYRTLNYLIRKFPISYAFSGALLFDKDPERKPNRRVAFFLPDYSSFGIGGGLKSNQLTPLLGAREEVDAVRKMVGGDLFAGNSASENTFKCVASKYKVIHIASHTILDEIVPTLSSIILTSRSDSTDDGLLHSYELYQLRLNAQLVILSGCNTGFGKLQMGEGFLSLARSFFYTGVRSIAYTLWFVADKAEAILVTSFYKGLSQGKRLDESLQSSKLEFLAEADPIKCHPYYWAGFVILGNTDPICLHKSSPEKLLIFIISILVGIGILKYQIINF